MNHLLILASKSPRRRQLLQQLGYQFYCENADIDESVLPLENAEDYVQRVAITKAKTVAGSLDKTVTGSLNQIVLAADTSVVVDGVILGKPLNFDDCQRMLMLLSNRQHQVLTAIAAIQQNNLKTKLITTNVIFKALSNQEIRQYWQTGEPQDKAGSYGIQGIAGQFVKSIQGSYSAVVGLPLYETVGILSEFGLQNTMNNSFK